MLRCNESLWLRCCWVDVTLLHLKLRLSRVTQQTQRLLKKRKKKQQKNTPQKKPWHRNLTQFWSSWNICWEECLEDSLTHWKMQFSGLDLKDNPFCTGEFVLFFCPAFLWQCLGGQYHCHHQCWRGKDRELCEDAHGFCSWKLYFVLIVLSQISVQRLNYVGNNLPQKLLKPVIQYQALRSTFISHLC